MASAYDKTERSDVFINRGSGGEAPGPKFFSDFVKKIHSRQEKLVVRQVRGIRKVFEYTWKNPWRYTRDKKHWLIDIVLRRVYSDAWHVAFCRSNFDARRTALRAVQSLTHDAQCSASLKVWRMTHSASRRLPYDAWRTKKAAVSGGVIFYPAKI